MKEMYRHLSLDMDDEEEGEQQVDEWTIEKGLAKFFRPEKRELKCEKCADGKTATQTLSVTSCPKILLLHLKRFKVVEKPRSLTPPPSAADDKENAEGSSPKKQAAIEMTFHKNKVCCWLVGWLCREFPYFVALTLRLPALFVTAVASRNSHSPDP
jgi:hypothetical protein